MHIRGVLAWMIGGLAAFLACGTASAAGRHTVIVAPRDATYREDLAAQEVRRYVYLRTSELLRIVPHRGWRDAVVVATKGDPLLAPLQEDAEAASQVEALGDSDYLLKTVDGKRHRTVYLVGGSDIGTLYAAYRFAEHLGVRFYLDGDTVPDERIPLVLPDLDEHRAPLFALRGIQPFHDFPEGPDWWNRAEYLAIVDQLPKLGMNFIGLHTYPNAEPTVWTGLAEDVAADGSVTDSYPTHYYNTAMDMGWGFTHRNTSDYACGAAGLFDRDDYGSDVMRGLTPQPDTPEECNELFNRTGALLNEVFSEAHTLGIKTCLGTETPLAVPGTLSDRLKDRADASQELYRGIFTRIMRVHPLDYYWFWTPELWTWEPVTEAQVDKTVNDLLGAHAAAKQVGAPFSLATCGWVLGPQYDRAYLDKVLPKDMAFSCINRSVGFAPVEPGFAEVTGRGKWAIPWLEDDPAMTMPQLWAGRMRRDARDALSYGCDGLMGIHWRTRILGPNVSALAQAAWDQTGWTPRSHRHSGVLGGIPIDCGTEPIGGTDADAIYQTVRYRMDGYLLAVPEGTYDLTLHFMEPQHTQPGVRIMEISVQGKVVADRLDVGALVGRKHAYDLTVNGVHASDGAIDIGFAATMDSSDAPCISAIEVKGEPYAQKINCGGPAIDGYIADPPLASAYPPADDFYADFARQAFGPEVGAAASAIFSRVDGMLPRPADWVGGPGGFVPDPRPWNEVKEDYAFVEAFAALRPAVVGAGNQERFDYWLNNFEYLRGMGHARCVWSEFKDALSLARAQVNDAAKDYVVRNRALPLRKELVAVVEAAYRHLLSSTTTTGAMGNIANLEGHTFPQMIEATGDELADLLGEPLPPDAVLAQTYAGPARMVVTAKRTCLRAGEPLAVRVAVLAKAEAPVASGALRWRRLGQGHFESVPLRHTARNTYVAEVAGEDLAADGLEYYLEATTSEGETVRWPVTAPALNQTVVIGKH